MPGQVLEQTPGSLPVTTSDTARARFAAAVDRYALFIFAVAVCGALVLARAPTHVAQDAWLALVAGRDIAQHGVPSHDHLTTITLGARWIDQQWLAQWLMYKLEQLGGLSLMVIACTLATMAGLAITLFAALRLGGDERRLTRVLPIPAFLFVIVATEIRTQNLAFPLFAGVLALLALDARRQRRSTYWVFPMLVLWGNLHGSVIVGVILTSLYGLVTIVEPWWRSRRIAWPAARSLAFLIGAPLCLLATPYGATGLDYYRETVFNSQFRTVITEWRPVTSHAVFAVPFFLLAFTAVWQMGRHPTRGTTFDRLVLLVTIAAGISSIRNVVWFALALTMLLPGIMAPSSGNAAPRRARVNLTIAATGMAAILGVCTFVAVQRERWFESDYNQRLAPVVASALASQPGGRVFADIHFADWLLWKDPALAGRVAYDARLELLTPRQLTAVYHMTSAQYDYRAVTAGYPLLVLDPISDPRPAHLLTSERGARILLRDRTVIVVSRQAGA